MDGAQDGAGLRADALGVRRAAGVVVGDLDGVDTPGAEICCGSAGIHNMVQPESAEELGRRKIAHIISARPDAVVTSNAGCLLQIRRYLDEGVPLFHPIQRVDASVRGMDPLPAAALRP